RGIESSTPGFHADQVDVAFVEKFREDTDRVGTPTDAGDYYIGQLAKRLQALFLGFRTDDSVELLDDPRGGVRTSRRSQQVVGVLIGCRPLPDGFVARLLEGLGADCHGHDLGTE